MEKVNEKDKEYRKGESGPKYLFRGPKIDWGVIRFLPGETLGKHFHERVEETFFFLKGAPLMIIGDQELRINEGDAVRLDPTDVHDIINDTDQVVDAVFMKHCYEPKDKVNA